MRKSIVIWLCCLALFSLLLFIVRLSFALNTIFCTAFTLVGEPALPICAGSASMSAAPHWVMSR